MTVASSRKKCPVTYSEVPPFFSLVDYRNDYFISDDPNKIMEFYNGFENRDQLIQWMKERPNGVANIQEVEGNKDIIVVIPTADFNGKYAKECREKIFKGLHIIFVESGEILDPYFNYAHNCNVGIRKAMEYDPKWVAVSNDDMYKIDEISILRKWVGEAPQFSDIILARKNGDYRSYLSLISRLNIFGKLLVNIFHILPLKGINFGIDSLCLMKKFDIQLIGVAKKDRTSKNVLLKKRTEILNVNNFVIFRSGFVEDKGGILFDETFINGYEDLDLTINILKESNNIHFIDYRIGDYAGSTLGTNVNRSVREVANVAYFNSKYHELIDILINSNSKVYWPP